MVSQYSAPQLYPDVYDRANIVGATQITPAAGADFSLTVPNGLLWSVRCLRGTFTASANAANRFVGFQVKNQDGTVIFNYNMTAAVTAGLVGVFNFVKDTGTAPTAFATNNRLLMPIPDSVIPAGWSFGTSTLNIDGSDAWTGVTLWVEELLPPEGE